jgi:selenocysteine lyase/cysteine desulfurase
LTSWLLEELSSLRHLNGNPLVTVHGPVAAIPRGGTVSMTLRDPSGLAWKAERVERLANEMRIAVRAGAHCNPGANEVATGVDRCALGRLYAETSNLPLDDFLWSHERLVHGVVRVSLGAVSDFSDVWRFAEFLRGLLDREANR